MGKHLADEDIVAEEGDSLREDRVVMVEGRGDDPLVEDRSVRTLTKRISLWITGRRKKWIGISLAGVFRIKGIAR